MKSFFKLLPALCLALAAGLASAQQPAPSPQPLKPGTPAAMAAAKEYLMMKNTHAMYQAVVPNIVARTRDVLLQSNLNYQKDLNEVAEIVAKKFAGKENEITEGIALVYCNEFSEQELKDIVAFYKTPLGQKLLSTEPKAVQMSMSLMNGWAQQFAETVNGEFRAEMRKRGKQI